jgi:hypothetical protein
MIINRNTYPKIGLVSERNPKVNPERKIYQLIFRGFMFLKTFTKQKINRQTKKIVKVSGNAYIRFS